MDSNHGLPMHSYHGTPIHMPHIPSYQQQQPLSQPHPQPQPRTQSQPLAASQQQQQQQKQQQSSLPPPPLPQQSQSQSQTLPHVKANPAQSLAHQQSSDGLDRSRAYKSRNRRPCDFCRYKKAACHLESQPPCELCVRYNKECTFVESPAKRRRGNEENGNSANSTGAGQSNVNSQSEIGIKLGHTPQSKSTDPYERMVNGSIPNAPHSQYLGGSAGGGMDVPHSLVSWDNGLAPFAMPGISMSPAINHEYISFSPNIYQNPSPGMPFEGFESMSAVPVNVETMPGGQPSITQYQSSIDTSPSSQPTTLPLRNASPVDAVAVEPSLDKQASSNSQVVGMSGELDPYILSRFRFDQYNEAKFQAIRIRRMDVEDSNNHTVPTFFGITHNGLASKAQPPPETPDRYRAEVEDMVSDEVGRRLIRLFYRYVQPYFPILAVGAPDERDDPSTMPTCILAAVYGHALAFCAWDEKLCVEVYTPPSADELFKIAWHACLTLVHVPTLAVLQALLLLVQRRPTNKHVPDTPFKWIMLSTAVSIAQALGINRDPSQWSIPEWEVNLRKRLSWATFVQDKWISLNFGRSSHIQADDWDLAPLSDEVVTDPDRPRDTGDVRLITDRFHFVKLCELTVIVDEILHKLFSLRASRMLHGDPDATMDVAKPLRLQLIEWHQKLPPGLFPGTQIGSPEPSRRRSSQHELDGNGSLQLAYLTAKLEIFRAMLRSCPDEASSSATAALRAGGIAAAKEVFDFLEHLNARELEAFWTSYARTNFTIASSFMLLLFITSPTVNDAAECLYLMNAWRSLLRVKSRSCDLLNLALLRLDAVYVAGPDRLIDLSPAAAQVWADSVSKSPPD